MKTSRTAQITIQTDETIVVRKIASSIHARCAECDAIVELASPERAAALTGVAPRWIYRWIEAGQIHFQESNGAVIVCLTSLHRTASFARGELGSPNSKEIEEKE